MIWNRTYLINSFEIIEWNKWELKKSSSKKVIFNKLNFLFVVDQNLKSDWDNSDKQRGVYALTNIIVINPIYKFAIYKW